MEEEEKQRWQELLHGVRHTHVSLLTEYEEKVSFALSELFVVLRLTPFFLFLSLFMQFREKYDAYLSHWESLLTSETQKLQDEAAKVFFPRFFDVIRKCCLSRFSLVYCILLFEFFSILLTSLL